MVGLLLALSSPARQPAGWKNSAAQQGERTKPNGTIPKLTD
jgi:hypothetical protein